jgi:deoxyribonuclease-4
MILGVHIAKGSKTLDDKTPSKEMSDAIVRETNELGLNAAQIFTYGPRQIVPNKIDFEKVKKVTTDIDLSVHSAYATTGIWKVNKENKSQAKSKRMIDVVKLQLASCKKIGAHSLVIHINKIFPDVAATTMGFLAPYAKKIGVKVVLEMVASKADPDKTYETPEKIDNLTTMLGPKETWWGWCIDTAHLWGAGVDVSKYEYMKDWLDRLTYKKKVVMFHLNGSFAKRGSGKDKHAIAFSSDDVIWYGIKPEESGVRAIVEFAMKYKIPIICEINVGLEEDTLASLAAIKKLGGIED